MISHLHRVAVGVRHKVAVGGIHRHPSTGSAKGENSIIRKESKESECHTQGE